MLASILILGWDLLCSSAAVLSQTTPDASLGVEASVLDAQDTRTVVSGGARRGSSLFHSFTALTIEDGRSLYFTQPSGIEQIFSRVTGSGVSEINGTLGVLGDADLFLLNPNGIRFGPNARLDLSGSFLGSTATAVQFREFDFATVPEPVPLLTVNAPIGLNFSGVPDGSSGRSPGVISGQVTASGVGLAVRPLQTLALVGGEVDLEATRFSGDSSLVELGAVQEGVVGLLPSSDGWGLDYGPELSKGDISLSGSSIQMRNSQNNPISAVRLVGEMIQLSEAANISTDAGAGTIIGPEVYIEGDRVTLSGGAVISTFAQADGIGGSVTVNAAEQLRLTGSAAEGTGQNSIIVSQTGLNSTGRGGDIVVDTRRLRLEDGGSIFSSTGILSDSNGGNITIRASESLMGNNINPAELRTTLGTETAGSGRGGQLSVTTGQLDLDDFYRLSALTWVDGAGGDIVVEAEAISLNGTNPLVPIFPSGIVAIALGSGEGGTIWLKTNDLTITDSANVTTFVSGDRATIAGLFSLLFSADYDQIVGLPGAGTGNAGDIRVEADRILVFGVNSAENSQPSNIISTSTGMGDAGNVDILTNLLEVRDGGIIGSFSILSFSLFDEPLPDSGKGQGGDLTINSDFILLTGSGSSASFPSALATHAIGRGDGGDTTINTRQLSVLNGAAISAGTSNSGNGGRLMINSSERVRVEGQDSRGQPATIGTFAVTPPLDLREAFFLPQIPTGDSGQLILNTPQLDIRDLSTVSVEHQGSGRAGDLDVNVDRLRMGERALLSATSLSGQGGDVNVRVQDVLSLRRESRISVEALGGQGNGGNLNIEAGAIVAIPTENSDIIANAVGGTGGDITLRTGGLFGIKVREQLTSDSDITASSQVGLDGAIRIDLLAIYPGQGLTELPTALLDPNEQISTACDRTARSRFVATGRGGLPNDPRQQFRPRSGLQDWRIPESEMALLEAQSGPTAKSALLSEGDSRQPKQIVEARRLRRDRSGKIHLTASQRSAGQAPSTPAASAFNCLTREILLQHREGQ